MNRNKKSITLNLQDSRGREVFYRMVEKADVVTENFRVGVTEKLGIDYKTLVNHNPKIIVASITPYGRKGPDAHLGALDTTAFAKSGLMDLCTAPNQEPLYVGPYALIDTLAGMMLAYGVVSAILARDRYGIGQEVDVSLLGSSIQFQALPVAIHLFHGQRNPLHQRRDVSNPLFSFYKAGNGRWLILACPQFDRYWPDFCQVMGLSHLIDDPRFSTQAAREENACEMVALIDEAFLSRSANEWIGLLNERGVNCILVQNYDEMVSDPQVLANEYIIEVQHASGVPFKTIGFPVQLSKTPVRFVSSAPQWGQHTEEVLLAEGYTWEQIAELKDNGII